MLRPMADPVAPPLTRKDQRAVAAELRRLLARVESGDLTASPSMVARLQGVAVTLDALSGKPILP